MTELLQVCGRVGVDLNAFPSEMHFANRLGLCPTHETSSGRALKRQSTEAADRQSGQPGQGGIPAGGFHLDPQPKLPGRAIPPPAHPIGRAQSHHRDGRMMVRSFYEGQTLAQ
jgi:hypothetical protein